MNQRTSALSDSIRNMRIQKQMRAKFDRAMPRLYVERNQKLLSESKEH